MTHEEREVLKKLIRDFEQSMARCRYCCTFEAERVDDPDRLCPKCWKIFQKAYDYEEEHAKFRLNDTEIAMGFQQAMGRGLEEDELLRLKSYMLDFECEDADNMVDVIKKIVVSLRMRNPQLEAMFTDD